MNIKIIEMNKLKRQATDYTIDELTTYYTIDIYKHDNSQSGYTVIESHEDSKKAPGDTVMDMIQLEKDYWDLINRLEDNLSYKGLIFCGPDEMIPGTTGHYTSDLMFTVKWAGGSEEEFYHLDGINNLHELLINTYIHTKILAKIWN